MVGPFTVMAKGVIFAVLPLRSFLVNVSRASLATITALPNDMRCGEVHGIIVEV
jgi:phosphoglycerate dehydrogenase-like enzyme